MKLARLFLAVLTISTLAACSDSVTGPRAEPAVQPSTTDGCVLERQADGTTVCRTGQTGSGG